MQRVDLSVVRGSTPVYELTIVDEDDVAIDITGYTVFFTAKTKTSDDDEDAIISYTITSHYDATSGITLISLTTVDTDRIGNLYYDIKIKTSASKIFYPLGGTIKFAINITQRTS